jgi:hypothetical protein
MDVKLIGDCEMYSYVTGQEAWFVATNQVQLATQLKAMIRPFTMANKPGFISTEKIVGVETVNLIMINMGTTETMNEANTGFNGMFTDNGTIGLKMSNSKHKLGMANPFKNHVLDAYLAAGTTEDGLVAPVFQDSNGATAQNGSGTALYNPYEYPDILLGTGGAVDPSFYETDAEYIALYYQGMGIMLEYYH